MVLMIIPFQLRGADMVKQVYCDACGKLLLRLNLGGLLLVHGLSKVLNPDSLDFIGRSLVAVDLPAVLAYGVYLGEVIAPIMIILGYRARLGAFIVTVQMAVAVGLVHMDDFLAFTPHGGWYLELQAFYLFGALAIVFLGSGKLALRGD
ncbi:conserved hypothetical membrane protein [Desulfotalea psychrophila LSv54]|uniref:Conserved hypothetical membrane protein n=2 Tax=Desulfotalea psychrophila TaxID=84980 RepID=Q6AS51_DESPS|nr:conserved hypothetical membrane protein [Desulfotalea psychrophila LSv54]